MTAILNFLQSIYDAIVNIGQRITDTFNGSVQVLEMIGEFRGNLQSYLAWIPDSVYIVISLGFGICCLYVILGRC